MSSNRWKRRRNTELITWKRIVQVCFSSNSEFMHGCINSILTLLHYALNEGVSSETIRTDAVWSVANYATLRVGSTWSWAWVTTFEIDARQVTCTFTVTDTFWTTVGRTTSEVRKARTWWAISRYLAYGIWSTWWWLTWILWSCLRWLFR
jgi:hypothetical protein